MKINNVSQKNNMNFGAIPLYKAILQQKRIFKKPEPLEALVSVVEKNDIGNEALDYRRWWFTRFGDEIINEMDKKAKHPHKNKSMFLMVEVPSFPPKKRVVAIASYIMGENNIILQTLQSKSETTLFNRVKGAGSLIVYALSRIANLYKDVGIGLSSVRSATNFYKKLGFVNIHDEEFLLPRASFQKFQEKLEEKFKIKKV